MKRVPADEFVEHAAEYLAAGEPVSVEKDGEIIGQYVPMPASTPHAANGTATNGHVINGTASQVAADRVRPDSREIISRLDRTLREIYDELGMTEEEFAEYFDLTKPFPYDADTKG